MAGMEGGRQVGYRSSIINSTVIASGSTATVFMFDVAFAGGVSLRDEHCHRPSRVGLEGAGRSAKAGEARTAGATEYREGAKRAASRGSFNMALEGTIEEYVLERLYDKIDLFTKTVGELSTVLTRLETSGTSFEEEIFDRLVDAGSDAELENDFDAMAVDLKEETDLSRKVERFNSGVFDGFDLGVGDD